MGEAGKQQEGQEAINSGKRGSREEVQVGSDDNGKMLAAGTGENMK